MRQADETPVHRIVFHDGREVVGNRRSAAIIIEIDQMLRQVARPNHVDVEDVDLAGL